VILAGGANPNNVFWQVGDSATIGANSGFQGNILAATSISMLTGATVNGRVLAIAGAVTIDTGGGSSVSIPATVSGPPATAIVSRVNAASYGPLVVAGSIASIFGSNLAVGQDVASGVPLPTTLAQSSIKIGGVAAPMYFATASQVNVQIPWEMAGQGLPSIIDTVNGV
jgi:type VI secretion system secreted protein VgrG